MKKIDILLAWVFLAVFQGPAFAVDFYDGVRSPEGLYFLTYSSFYDAGRFTGAKGNTSNKDYGYRKFEELFRLCYYHKDLVFTVLLPAGDVRSGFYDVSSKGLGDVNLGAGGFLPVKQMDILPMLFVKFPTGEYDVSRKVNYGSDQYDIKPTVFFYKEMGNFSFDGAAKYLFRMENPKTDIAPGDELHLQGLLGWKFSRFCKAGPSLSWMKSSCQEFNGNKIRGTGREYLSAGAEVYFRFPLVRVTLSYLRDVSAKNTTKGDFYQVKTCYKF